MKENTQRRHFPTDKTQADIPALNYLIIEGRTKIIA